MCIRDSLIRRAKTPTLVPQTEAWAVLIEKVLGGSVVREQRYAIKKEGDHFDRRLLRQYAESLDTRYELRAIDEVLYEQIMAEPWSEDLCSQFQGGKDFVKRGIGFVAVLLSLIHI